MNRCHALSTDIKLNMRHLYNLPCLYKLRQRRYLRKVAREFSRNGLLKNINRDYLRDVQRYWIAHYGMSINPLYHIAFSNVTGVEDVRFIPNHIWWNEILPFLNRLDMRPAYNDKNLADLLIGSCAGPRTILKRMHGRYYSPDNKVIKRSDALRSILLGPEKQIIKASQTDNGVSIREIIISGSELILGGRSVTLDEIEKAYGPDFIVQEKIRQHPTMGKPHPSSVNTVRLVTFRWNDQIRVLLAFARFGSDGKITDNAGTGGLCCGINDTGEMSRMAVDHKGNRFTKHPSTGFSFDKQFFVPAYSDICECGLKMHEQIPHFDIVSWDFAVGEDGKPICLEVNFRGAAFIYQFACGPLFGDLTSSVLESVRKR